MDGRRTGNCNIQIHIEKPLDGKTTNKISLKTISYKNSIYIDYLLIYIHIYHKCSSSKNNNIISILYYVFQKKKYINKKLALYNTMFLIGATLKLMFTFLEKKLQRILHFFISKLIFGTHNCSRKFISPVLKTICGCRFVGYHFSLRSYIGRTSLCVFLHWKF